MEGKVTVDIYFSICGLIRIKTERKFVVLFPKEKNICINGNLYGENEIDELFINGNCIYKKKVKN